MDKRAFFLFQNIAQLEQGATLLGELSDDGYSLSGHKYFGSGVGKHMRHILDHYQSFFRGFLELIDYDDRTRDERLETDRLYAISSIESIVELLDGLPEVPQGRLSIRCNEGSPKDLSLASHTIHHYALIAMILRVLGKEAPRDFGVAPSTLAFEKREASLHAN